MSKASVAESTERGWRTFVLDGGTLLTTVIPERGAEISSLVHKPSETELLCQVGWERPSPDDPPLEGSGDLEFLQGYAGGWQELFPNSSDESKVDGVTFPFHGEAATGAWSVEPEDDRLVAIFVSPRTGLELTRTMSVNEAEDLVLDEVVMNPTSSQRHFTWGHHLVLGAPLIGSDCILDLPVTRGWIPSLPGDSQRLVPTDDFSWPSAPARSGDVVDLRKVPSPGKKSHDGVYLTGLTDGYVAAENPSLGLRFQMSFDSGVFRWVTLWEPLGGIEEPPLAGMYGIGIEPWRSSLPLGEAIEAGEALTLDPGEEITTRLTVRVSSIEADEGKEME